MVGISSCCFASSDNAKSVRSFWLLGMINNAPWFLMNAVATNISAGGVALVFVANMLPGLAVNISAPYWFHLVSYKIRILSAASAMGAACIFVGCGGLFQDDLKGENEGPEGTQRLGLGLQLFGVSLMSIASNMGEASLLALAGKFDSMILPSIASSSTYEEIADSPDSSPIVENYSRIMNQSQQKACITAYASGAGIGGVVGFGCKAILYDYLGLGLSVTVWSAVVFAFAYAFIYLTGLHVIMEERERTQILVVESSVIVDDSDTDPIRTGPIRRHRKHRTEGSGGLGLALALADAEFINHCTVEHDTDSTTSPNFTAVERFKLVLSLWPYMIPMFTVYAAEYTLQAGVWSSIGFPVTSASARAEFYQYANWMYQIGVFISRSSGNMWSASIPILWLMPFLQVVNLCFFWMVSIHHFLYNYSLMVFCFFAGLLGGSVFVQGFSRISIDMPMEKKELAIASAVVSMNLGILTADVLSLFIQSCIYSKNGIEGAVATCPINM